MFFTGHLTAFGNSFGCSNWRNTTISSEESLGILLQSTGQPPTTNNYVVKNVNSSQIEKPFLRVCNLKKRPQRRNVASQNHQVKLRSFNSQSSPPLCFCSWFCFTTVDLKVSVCWVSSQVFSECCASLNIERGLG